MIDILNKVSSVVSPYDGKTHLSIAYKQPLEAKPQETLLAWATKVDITPPPGLPTAGHSVYSTNGVGFRNKLKARVVYLKPKQGRPVALVQCDLIAGSRIVHHKVAEMIADKTDVDSPGLVICATHTHSGPANFMGNKFYNDTVGNSMGFIEKYFNFLCERLSSAVIDAYENRKPAKIATGTTTVTGVTKNRSLPAFLKNKNIQNQKDAPNEYQAINPDLHMIRIDCQTEDGSYLPVGAFTNFSNHPNSRPSELENLYHGDITAFAERILEQNIKKQFKPAWDTVHAAANYTHGDCNPNHSETIVENFADLRKLGQTIADRAFELFLTLGKELTTEATIGSRAREIDLLKENVAENIHIAKRPAMGLASMAGAKGRGRGSLVTNVPFFAAGYPRKNFKDSDQGEKRVAFGVFQQLRYKKEDYPHHFFAQIIQINDHVLLPMPWEVTAESGKRIANHLQEKAKSAGASQPLKFIVTNVSNGYFGYMTTPEEYSQQYYEGGSNQYGANTCDYIKLQLGQDIEKFVKGEAQPSLASSYHVSLHSKDYYPEDLVPTGNRSAYTQPVYQPATGREEAYWEFQWQDVPANMIEFHRSLVRIEARDSNDQWVPLEIDGVPVDDDGMDISVKHLNQFTETNMALYQVRWHSPELDQGKEYRFAILPRNNWEQLSSQSFKATNSGTQYQSSQRIAQGELA
ncbi:MAG: neutral/alkaline non-lysosomal ceramidase N-terminal domain-containing protein [Pseudomonadales bacterium]|nr:neutral/alkaline non-lysosomal ceramidase N-terminal domain-containing protein [Pseudomonadales bacterium]